MFELIHIGKGGFKTLNYHNSDVQKFISLICSMEPHEAQKFLRSFSQRTDVFGLPKLDKKLETQIVNFISGKGPLNEPGQLEKLKCFLKNGYKTHNEEISKLRDRVDLLEQELKTNIPSAPPSVTVLEKQIASLQKQVSDLANENTKLKKASKPPKPLTPKERASAEVLESNISLMKLRQEHGATQKELAIVLDVNRRQQHQIEQLSGKLADAVLQLTNEQTKNTQLMRMLNETLQRLGK